MMGTEKPTTDESVSTKGLLAGALGFLVAAKGCYGRRDTDGVHWPAIFVNLGFALELSLKAVVFDAEKDEVNLRLISHDLIKALHEAERCGYISLHPAILDLVEMLSGPHKNMSLRYLSGGTLRLGSIESAIATVELHLKTIGDKLAAKLWAEGIAKGEIPPDIIDAALKGRMPDRWG